MSSRKAAAPKRTQGSDAQQDDLSRDQKAAFVKAMMQGIPPGTEAARQSEAKRSTAKRSTAKRATAKAGTAKSGAAKADAAQEPAPKKMPAKKTPAKKTPAKQPAAKKASAGTAAGAGEQEPQAPRVEVLRKISGPAAVVSTPESDRALELARQIEQAVLDGKLDAIQPHAVQALMTALCKVYSAHDENDMRYPILAGRLAISGTDAMVVCGALLKAVDLQVFELGMFQSWSGR